MNKPYQIRYPRFGPQPAIKVQPLLEVVTEKVDRHQVQSSEVDSTPSQADTASIAAENFPQHLFQKKRRVLKVPALSKWWI